MRPIVPLAAAAALLWPMLVVGQDSTIVLTNARLSEAASNNFVFLLSERSLGSRCFTSAGQNRGLGTWARAVSEGLNGYAASTCRHHGLSPQRLQNGWRVSRVSTSQSCQYKSGSTWSNLTSSQCTFTMRTTPTVGSDLAIFEADVSVRGSAFQDRRATLTWTIELRGPAGRSPWALQAPGEPALQSPEQSLRLTTGSASFRWTAPATGAAEYRLFFTSPSGQSQLAARVTGTQTGNITVPFRGQQVRWFVQACNSRGCTSSADSRTILNLLPSATLSSPAEGATASNRRPTFQWQLVTGAETYELYAYRENPHQEFRISNLSSNVTSFTPASDLTLDSPIYWSVNACTRAIGCGSPANVLQIRTLNLPALVNFSTHLAPSFKHDRCRNCHAVAATGFQRGVGGLPSSHSVVSSSTNCAQSNCHVSTLLPAEGTIAPGWHAAPSTMDLRNKTDNQLCLMARNPGSSATSALQHLSQDKLVLWAVGNGKVPGKTLPIAPPGSITDWRARVAAWYSAGMPCN